MSEQAPLYRVEIYVARKARWVAVGPAFRRRDHASLFMDGIVPTLARRMVSCAANNETVEVVAIGDIMFQRPRLEFALYLVATGRLSEDYRAADGTVSTEAARPWG